MKRLCIMITMLLLFQFLLIPSPVKATQKSFHTGALVIPMDSTFQPSADGGILEAYGLIFELLQNGITVYWIVDENKTSITAPDVTISDTSVNPVSAYYNHVGTTANTLGVTNSITYSGGPFVISYSDEAAVINILATTASDWSAVDIHKVVVPFTANVIRELTGTPPKIALMNSVEDKTSGNASILESYVRLAGICANTYDVVTPNEIAAGILTTGAYDLLWAPHWTGYESYLSNVETIVNEVASFLDNGKSLFAECASIEVFEHSANGKFLSTNDFGHNGVAQDITSLVPPGEIIYNDATSPFTQVGDFTYEPTGGHLHNWRPYITGDPYSDKLPSTPVTPPDSGYHNYVSRFTYFDIDGASSSVTDQWDYYVGGRKDGDPNKGYVVYLGGHKYASCSGGMSSSSTPGTREFELEFKENFSSSSGAYDYEFEFKKDISSEVFTFTFYYSDGSNETAHVSSSMHNVKTGSPIEIDFTGANFSGKKIQNIQMQNTGGSNITLEQIYVSWSGGHSDQKTKKFKLKSPTAVDIWNHEDPSGTTLNTVDLTMLPASSFIPEVFTITFHHSGGSVTASVSDASHNVKTGTPLEVDFTSATFSGKKIENIILKNLDSSPITISSMDVSWVSTSSTQRIKKVRDVTLDDRLWDQETNTLAVLDTTDVSLEPASSTSSATSCTNNSDCTPTNISAVRYVLNTLFNLQYTVISKEYTRSTPVVSDNILYQGTFLYPSYKGHFYAYDAKAGTKTWDAKDTIPADAARTIFTHIDGVKQDFTVANIANLRSSLSLTPTDGDDTDEIELIKRVRGLVKSGSTWADSSTNKLGGIEHSAPAIIEPNARVNATRKTAAYVGSMDGMLHSFDVNQGGKELWAFIPGNALAKLKNDRTDANSINDYAAVDASPTARDVFIDHDGDGTPSWRTIITSAEGNGGTSIFCIDVTNPDTPIVLWEISPTGTGIGHASGMGNAFRTTISKVSGSGGTIKYSIITATDYANQGAGVGGIQVFSIDLASGSLNWQFSADYTSTINEIPGAIASYDIDGDSFADRVVVGDMEGRLWELDIADGKNPNKPDSSQAAPKVYLDQVDKTTLYNMPLYNAGSGKPIAASPSIVKLNNSLVIILGTGGADWASNSGTYAVVAVDATDSNKTASPTYASGAGTVIFSIPLAPGEKVWSSPTIAAGQIYFATAFGTLEGADPTDGVLSTLTNTNTGNLYAYDISASGTVSQSWKKDNIGQVRSSVFVSDEHIYATTLGGTTVSFGSGTYDNALSGGQAKVISWRDKGVVK